MDGGQAAAGVLGEAHHPLDAQQVSGAIGRGATHPGRHGVGERIGGRRVDPDLGRQLGIGHEGGHRRGGQLQPFLDVGQGGQHVGRGEIAQGWGFHVAKSRQASAH